MLAPCRVNRDTEQGGGDEAGFSGPERRVGRIDTPPDPRAHAAFPDDFGRRFLIFCDTEEEFDWEQPLARENVGTTAMEGLPGAQDFFREAGAKPIYVVDYPIVDQDRPAAIIADMHARDGCEIGTQLHPWVNPPFDEAVTPENSFTGNLPVELQRAKLLALTDRIEERVGVRPTIYRAGRYGIGEVSSHLLEEAGYRLDSSVRALFDYSEQSGPDFSGFGTSAFWAGRSRELLELPLTATYVGSLRAAGSKLYGLSEKIPFLRGGLARSGMLRRVSLTPEDYPLGEALEAIEQLLDQGLRIFNLSFHSPSVVPGHTPYVRDAADLKDFYRWWEGVFDLFARHGVTATTGAELVDAARAAR